MRFFRRLARAARVRDAIVQGFAGPRGCEPSGPNPGIGAVCRCREGTLAESGHARTPVVLTCPDLSPRSVLIAGGSVGWALQSPRTRCGEATSRPLLRERRPARRRAGRREASCPRPSGPQRYVAVEAAVDLRGLDVVVNAVGVVAFGNVVDLSLDTMEELFLTNTFVPIALAKAALAPPTGGVINIPGDRRAEPARHGCLRRVEGSSGLIRRSPARERGEPR